MSEPFLSEIRIFSFNYAPQGWAMCNGQFLPINQNQGLFSLLGTTFGGNGQTTFALPDLRARTPIHVGGGHTLGEKAGESAHTLTIAELPTHTHVLRAAEASADNNDATGRYLGSSAATYRAPSALTALAAGTVTNAGGSQPHENRQPYLALTFGIALQGIFPSPN